MTVKVDIFRRKAPYLSLSVLWIMQSRQMYQTTVWWHQTWGGGGWDSHHTCSGTLDFEICFLSDLFKKLLIFSAKLPLMRWIWAVLSSSTFSWNTNDDCRLRRGRGKEQQSILLLRHNHQRVECCHVAVVQNILSDDVFCWIAFGLIQRYKNWIRFSTQTHLHV